MAQPLYNFDQLRLFPEAIKKPLKNTNYRFDQSEKEEIERLNVPPYTYLKAKTGKATEEDFAKYPQLRNVLPATMQTQNIHLTPDRSGVYSTTPEAIKLEFEKKMLQKELEDLKSKLNEEKTGLQGIVKAEFQEKERQRELEDLKSKLDKVTRKKDKWKTKAEALEAEVEALRGQTNLLGIVEKITPKLAEGLSVRFPDQAEALTNGLAGLASGGAYVPTKSLKDDEKQYLEFYRVLRENLAPVKMRTVFDILNLILAYPHLVDKVHEALKVTFQPQNQNQEPTNQE